ncbi:hypothetical protein HYN59_08570 [Flavobacterium album]|uniref:Uncharacterized protein n=1 Tax=Flavobacterium album TaxID=2175091 RepID=A0A2S1QXQ8_9FLAO|nr:hypothetical protein [Flavobacterium album]AWH85173.1 hypothetical protein HYN59_08570 [Flavobacterium album]
MENNANDRNRPDNERLNEIKNMKPDTTLPYEDPAVLNPEELATFPKRSKIASAGEVEKESEDHLVNRRSPVREGRNIIRTDNDPNNEGFL